MSPDRQQALVRAFVGLADTLVSDYDVSDLVQALVDSCVALLDVDAAGIMLSSVEGGLQVLASSTHQTRALELLQLQSKHGPCVDCYESGLPVVVPDLGAEEERWPEFAKAARAEGYASALALPLRLREHVIGALNLFRTHTGEMPDEDRAIAQALADTATIGIMHERTIYKNDLIVQQRQAALDSRVLIEQAKGILVAHGGLDVDETAALLRSFAASHEMRLTEVAKSLISGSLDPAAVLGVSATRGQSPPGAA